MSRQSNPKQFQVVMGDKSMLRTTYERVAPILKNKEDLFLSVHWNFYDRARAEVPELGANSVIVEPDTRNTGPAMCLEVCYLERFCGRDEIIASLPSDDYISDDVKFRELLEAAGSFLAAHPEYVLTPAIKPSCPDTGYSYFRAGRELGGSQAVGIYEVAEVIEKPKEDLCQELVASADCFCHTGKYIWQLGHISDLFQKHQPEMYRLCSQVAGLVAEGGDIEEAAELYGRIEKMSIETAITSQADKIAMCVSQDIGWSDLGKWHVIKKMLHSNEAENVTKGDVMMENSGNNLVYSNVDKKIVVVNDVNGLAIVDTEDALFISSLEHSADIKNIIEKLKEAGGEKYL
jgi:mannose-1-phosphate guanylyltransferase